MFANVQRVKAVILFLVFILCPVMVHAMEPKMHTITLAPEINYFTYKEDQMKETGFLYGLSGAYTYRGEAFAESLSQAMFKVEGRIIFGRVDYDGHLFDGNAYKIDNVRDILSEFRGLAGYDFTIFSDTTVTPFIGLGFRYLKDDLSKDNAGYRRISNYLYTPIGFETNTPISDGWSAGLNMEYDIFWLGRQMTYLSDLDPRYSDVTNDQSDGYGFKASIKIRKAKDDKNYLFEPYVSYWNIDDSDLTTVKYSGTVTATVYEPKNTATEIGMKVGVEF